MPKNFFDFARNGLRLRVHTRTNNTMIAYLDDPRANQDDIGALYYVVAVVLIYGLSIVMMIASHIRKNQQDNQLRTYLKEMAILRKSDRRDKILCKIGTLANAKCARFQSSDKENKDVNEPLNPDPAKNDTQEEDVGDPLIPKPGVINDRSSQVLANDPDESNSRVSQDTRKQTSTLPCLHIQVIDENTAL